MENEAKKVALMGLLHDIGKFSQRAFWGERKRHEEHGSEWLETHVLPKLKFLSDQQKEEIYQVVLRHHEPSPYEWDLRVLKLADYLASGERVERESEDVGDPSQELLIPVFARLRLGNRFLPIPEQQRWRYHTKPLRLEIPNESIFPRQVGEVQADYQNLWREFEQAWQLIPNVSPTFSEFDAFVLTWLSLLRIYAWCVPAAAYKHEPDIALADHLQMTGAMAFCLWELDNSKLDRLESELLDSEVEVALLIGGDICGIQRFIYTISSKGAAKSLRGRSAYLNLLCDAIAEWLRRELELPPCNIVYSSGGHFYMLAPLSARGKVEGLNKELSNLLLDFFGGDVAIVVDALSLKAKDFRVDPSGDRSPLGQRWGELSAKLRERKLNLWRSQAIKEPAKVFGPFGQGGEIETCEVCYSEPNEPESLKRHGVHRPVEEQTKGEETVFRCSLCSSFEELADGVWRAKYLLLRHRSQSPRGELKWHTILQALGFEIWLDDENELARHYHNGDWVFRLNEPDLSPAKVDLQIVPVIGFRFMPQHTPTVTDAKTARIADLTELSERSEGAPYFGVVRMDVDSLGRLFSEGLGGMASLSRLATLSRSLTVFFEGYLNEICKQVGPERIYLLYSGGDDLFAVGSWDSAIDLAEKVRDQFRQYTCHNPCLTVSAGVSVHHEKFPLYQAAEVARNFLERAKNFVHTDGHEKDAFGFWGQTVDWDETQKWLRDWHDRIVKWLKNHKATRAFLFKLTRIAELHAELERRFQRELTLTTQEIERRLKFEKWRWRLVYTIAREQKDLQEQLQQFQRDLVERGFIQSLFLLTRWTELSTRG